MKRKIICLGLVLMLVMSALPGLAVGEYLGMLTVVNCNEWVSLRELPNTSSQRIVKVPLGAKVEAYNYNSEFCFCCYGDYAGYILSAYLSNKSSSGSSYGDTGSISNTPGERIGKMRVVNCNEWVSLREQPSTSSARLAKVPLGDVVEAYSYNAEFVECYYDGSWGYILRKYLSAVDLWPGSVNQLERSSDFWRRYGSYQSIDGNSYSISTYDTDNWTTGMRLMSAGSVEYRVRALNGDTTIWAPVYSEASTNSNLLAEFEYKTYIDVIGYYDGWYLIILNEIDSYGNQACGWMEDYWLIRR